MIVLQQPRTLSMDCDTLTKWRHTALMHNQLQMHNVGREEDGGSNKSSKKLDWQAMSDESISRSAHRWMNGHAIQFDICGSHLAGDKFRAINILFWVLFLHSPPSHSSQPTGELLTIPQKRAYNSVLHIFFLYCPRLTLRFRDCGVLWLRSLGFINSSHCTEQSAPPPSVRPVHWATLFMWWDWWFIESRGDCGNTMQSS